MGADVYIRVHSSISHHGQKVQVIQVSTEEWTDKQMSFIHAMKFYSTLKRKEILTHSTTPRMNFEDITLRENKPVTEIDKHYKWVHLHEVSRAVKFIETESA